MCRAQIGCAMNVPWCGWGEGGSGALTGEAWNPGRFAWSRTVTQPIERDAIYRHRRFPREVIETCVRWYLTYHLSYRDLVASMAERDVHVAHTTIMRWVFQYVPEYERRWNRRAKPVGSSWRFDETYVHTRPKMGYLYRAVDKQGKTVDSLFQTGRGIAAAMAFFRKALAFCAPRLPQKLRWMDTNPVIWVCADLGERIIGGSTSLYARAST
jgi:transposase-like protein